MVNNPAEKLAKALKLIVVGLLAGSSETGGKYRFEPRVGTPVTPMPAVIIADVAPVVRVVEARPVARADPGIRRDRTLQDQARLERLGIRPEPLAPPGGMTGPIRGRDATRRAGAASRRTGA